VVEEQEEQLLSELVVRLEDLVAYTKRRHLLPLIFQVLFR
jgi:hypothetical protein